MTTRVDNAKRNIKWGAISKTVEIFPTFILRTILIQILGAEYLGLNGVFTSILQVLSIAELGFDNAIVFCLYKPVAIQDNKTVCALLKFYRKVYGVIGIVILICGILLIPFLEYFIRGDYPKEINLYLLYSMYLANTILSYIFFSYNNAVIKALQRDDIKCKIMAEVHLLLYVLQGMVIIYTKNYYLYILLLPLSTIAMNAMKATYVKKNYPEYVCRGEISSIHMESIKKNVAGAMIFKVCGVFRNSFDSIVISAFLGLVALTKYQNYYFIVATVMQLIAIINTAIVAGVGNSIATETVEKNYSDFKKYSFLMFWIIGWCTVCLFCLYQPFMELWMGKEYMFDYDVVILFCIYFYGLQIGNITYVYREAAGIWWEDRYRPAVEAVANLVLNIILVQKFGIYGVIFSTVFTILIIAVPWTSHILFSKYFKQNVFSFFEEIVKQAGLCMIMCLLTSFLCSLIHGDLLTTFLIKIGICCTIPNLIWIMINRRREEFSFIKELPRKILQKQITT